MALGLRLLMSKIKLVHQAPFFRFAAFVVGHIMHIAIVVISILNVENVWGLNVIVTLLRFLVVDILLLVRRIHLKLVQLFIVTL